MVIPHAEVTRSLSPAWRRPARRSCRRRLPGVPGWGLPPTRSEHGWWGDPAVRGELAFPPGRMAGQAAHGGISGPLPGLGGLLFPPCGIFRSVVSRSPPRSPFWPARWLPLSTTSSDLRITTASMSSTPRSAPRSVPNSYCSEPASKWVASGETARSERPPPTNASVHPCGVRLATPPPSVCVRWRRSRLLR